MKLDTKIIHNNQVIVKAMRKEFIILDINRGKLYKLNETAKTIWKCTRKPNSLQRVIETIQNEFSVDQNKAKKDVEKFISAHINSLFFIAENE